MSLAACGGVGARDTPARLVIGGDANYPPFEWLDQRGYPQGFNVELMRLLAGPDVELEFRLGTWPDTLAALDEGRFDVVPMFASDQRREHYRFTNVFAYQTHALFARPETAPVDDIERPAELDLVVESGSQAQTELRTRWPMASPKLAADTLEALRLVAAREAEYALLAAPVARELIGRHQLNLERKSAPLWPSGYAFAVMEDRQQLAEWLQTQMVTAMGDGRYLALLERWASRLEPGVEPAPVVRSFGYRIAENMVRSFGEALKQTFPEPVAHLGRGTYAVFDPEGTAHLQLDRLEDVVRGTESLVHPRFICGSAFWPEDHIEINQLLHKAELALVESQARQSRWSRYRSHLQSDPLDLSIVDHFRRDDIQGLWFALQPQVSLPDQRCCGAELLARWQHPELGELSPVRFVPLLENAGLVDRLTWKAIGAGVELLVKHGRQHPDMTLSINVSARDLARADFHEQLERRIHAAGCPARQLKLEITETGLLNDRSLVLRNLERLSDLGLIFSIDDFGTGYSSLDYISRFPIREVKIDRSFVGRMLQNPRDLSIVRSTIALAHEMDMRVVGEGAETNEHVKRLIELECDLAQGWATGYPETEEEFFARTPGRQPQDP